jgi:hypothetical protein
MKTRLPQVACALALAVFLEANHSTEAMGDPLTAPEIASLHLAPREGAWTIDFVCFESCNRVFNSAIRAELRDAPIVSAYNTSATGPTYLVVYSAPGAGGDEEIRLPDDDPLFKLTDGVAPARIISVDLRSLYGALWCQQVVYVKGLDDKVSYIIVDYLTPPSMTALNMEMVRRCADLTLSVFQRR